MTSTLTRPVPSRTEAPTDDFVTARRFAWLTAAEAANDSRTPESYLLTLPLTDEAQLHALLARRPMSAQLAGRVVFWVSSYRPQLVAADVRNEMILAATRLPHMTARWLQDLTNALDRFSDGFHNAAVAIVRHPSASEDVVARVLCHGAGAIGTGTVLELEAASAGYLAATALRLVQLEGSLPRTTRRHALESTKTVLAELETALGDCPERRRAVAALGPSWTATRDDLLDVATGIAQPN